MMAGEEGLRLVTRQALAYQVRWRIICAIEEPVCLADGISDARWRKFVDWLKCAPCDGAQMQSLLKYVHRCGESGGWYFEDMEDIAKHDPNYGKYLDGETYDWIKDGGIYVPSQKPQQPKGGDVPKPTAKRDARRKRPRMVLQPIRNVAACMYEIDLPSNSITYRPGRKTYRIPRGEASKVVNRLVRGMVTGIREKCEWFVRFTQKDERILHRASGSSEFYRERIFRTPRPGDGHQLYGDTARLKE